jgi:hypothetical protein
MRILRIRPGFQADHSSSSYLFYAVDRPVRAKGQQVAHRFSSRAEVDEHTARYHKWGERELSWDTYKALLTEHYDVMASESYDWWTLMIAVPKTADMQSLLAPFQDARGYDDLGIDVEDYGRRLVINVYCMFDYGGPLFEFSYDEDSLEQLVEMLAEIRGEILQDNVSFLQAVASYYGADEDEEEEPADSQELAGSARRGAADLSKAELQQECTSRGIDFRKSWTKDQLRAALRAAGQGPAPVKSAGRGAKGRPAKLSPAARNIVASLDRP